MATEIHLELLTRYELAQRVPGLTPRRIQHLTTTNYNNFRRCVVQTGLKKRLYDINEVFAWLQEQRLGDGVEQNSELQPVG